MQDLLEVCNFPHPNATAEGRVCVELKDPQTGRVTDKVQWKNHVFTEALFSANTGAWWGDTVNNVYTVMTDDDAAVDTTFPYMLGNVIGYGIPSSGSSGATRGAYNSTNQVLAKMTLNSCRWKFQYDFTTAQANGTIKSIGLTNQYSTASLFPFSSFSLGNSNAVYYTNTCDGQYGYSCSTAGIITKRDLLLDTSTTIDVSAFVGTEDPKDIGYASDTGKYYVFTITDTASNRKGYVFSDNTFSTLETTYSMSNVAFTDPGYPIYVCGNYVFQCNGSGSVYYADFVNNLAYSTISTSGINISVEGISFPTAVHTSSTATKNYLICGCNNNSNYSYLIIDMRKRAVVGLVESPNLGLQSPLFKYPLTTESTLLCVLSTDNYRICHNAAITKCALPTPVVKDSSHGMTVTYELEVKW